MNFRWSCCIVMVGLFLLSTSILVAQENTLDNLQIITPENVGDIAEMFILEHELDSIPNLVWSSNRQWMVATGLGGLYLFDLSNPGRSQVIDTTPLLLQGGATMSADGRLLATAGLDYLALWDLITGERIGTAMTEYPPATMQFSPDARVLAMTANGNVPSENGIDTSTVYLWDVDSLTQYGTAGFYDLVTRSRESLPFTFDGEALLTLRDGVIQGWDYLNPENNRPAGLMTKDALIVYLEQNYPFTPRDAVVYEWIAYQNEDWSFALWLTADDGSAYFIAQDGTGMAVVPFESGVDFDEEGIPQMIEGYTRLDRTQLVQSLYMLEQLTFPTSDGSVAIINRDTATTVIPRYAYNTETNTITDRTLNLTFMGVEQSGVGRFISADGDVLLQRYYALDNLASEPETIYTVNDANYTRFTSDGQLLTVRDGDDDRAFVQLIDLTTGEAQFEIELRGWDGNFESVGLNPDSSLLVYGIFDSVTQLRGLNVIDTQTGRGILTLPYSGDGVSFNFDGSLLVFRSADAPLSVWGVTG